MKKKLYSLLSLLLIVVQGAMAAVTITAPTKPAALEKPVEGKQYGLYCCENGKFVGYNSGNQSSVQWYDTPQLLTLQKLDNGTYAFVKDNYYIESYNNYLYVYQWNTGRVSYKSFNIVTDENGISKIQNASVNGRYYDANSWWGVNPSNPDQVVWNGNGTWMLVPEDVCSNATSLDWKEIQEHGAKTALYNAIVQLDAKGYPVARYEAIYNDASQTSEALQTLAKQINNSESLTNTYNYLLDKGDYPITIMEASGGWKRNSSNNEICVSYSSSPEGKQTKFTTSVNVDQPSAFVFHLYSNNRWTNIPSLSFIVKVDGKVAYEYNGETYHYVTDSYFSTVLHGNYDIDYYGPYGNGYYYYSSGNFSRNRHFVDLESGHHVIEIETTAHYDDYYFAIFLSGLSVMKTPELSVSLSNAGTLYDEVLHAMDKNPLFTDTHIDNVRKLKISGTLDDSDWNTIYSMAKLYSLDLSEVNTTEIKERQLSLYSHSSLGYLRELKLPKGLTTIGKEAFCSSYIENVDIPETVTEIGDFAFFATRLKHANIPNVKSLGHNAFRQCTMLEDVTMKNVETIGINAFTECYNIKNVVFEGTPAKVPQRMFYGCNGIETVNIPETVTDIETYAFYINRKSQLSKLPDGLKTIESYALYGNYYATFSLPEGLKKIGSYGVANSYRMTGDLPTTLTSVGEQAFAGAYRYSQNRLDTLHLAPNATYDKEAFKTCGIKNYVIPQTYDKLLTAGMFTSCDSLQSIKLMSPTMMTVASDFVAGLDRKAIKVIVPVYLKYTYGSDNYWKNFDIQTFSTVEMDSITIKQDLKLSQHNRFEGTPSVSVDAGTVFTIYGTSGMELKNMTLSNNLVNNSYGQVHSASDAIHINGITSERLYTAANKWYFLALPFDCDLKRTVNENGAQYAIRYYDGAQRAAGTAMKYPESDHNYANNLTKDTPRNKQTFSWPGSTNLKIVFSNDTYTYNSDDKIFIEDASGNVKSYSGTSLRNKQITLNGDHFNIWIESNGSYVAYGYSINEIYADDVLLPKLTGDNWKNYDCSSDIIKAGTGFILMTSQDSWTRFYSVDNGTKQTVFFSVENENNEQHFELQKHESTIASNRGWNLVGNPYPNYYNNHHISFSAPITLWNGSTYVAKSLHDDDVAIKPCEAIFVQCPDVAEIAFPASGRQTTDEIKDQGNGGRAMTASASAFGASQRRLVDVAITGNDGEDKTRVVVNDMSTVGYEMSCDAAKFMSMDASVPQIYSLDADDTKYAINERPLNDGTVRLGTHFPKSGDYTIALARTAMDRVLLTDNETGETVNITDDEYTFAAEAGTTDSRFTLTLVPAPTSVEGVEAEDADNAAAARQIFTIDGRKVNGMNTPGTYIVRGKKGVRKVVSK